MLGFALTEAVGFLVLMMAFLIVLKLIWFINFESLSLEISELALFFIVPQTKTKNAVLWKLLLSKRNCSNNFDEDSIKKTTICKQIILICNDLNIEVVSFLVPRSQQIVRFTKKMINNEPEIFLYLNSLDLDILNGILKYLCQEKSKLAQQFVSMLMDELPQGARNKLLFGSPEPRLISKDLYQRYVTVSNMLSGEELREFINGFKEIIKTNK